jgi:alpha-aminoadipate/glutamate carrier protein LysW
MTKRTSRGRRKMTNCPECDANISIPSDAVEGEIVTCPDCGASYELVKAAEGFELKPAQTVGEDWGQ